MLRYWMLNLPFARNDTLCHSISATSEKFAVRLSVPIPVAGERFTYHSDTAPASPSVWTCARTGPRPPPAQMQMSLCLFHWGIWTLTSKHNSDLSVRGGVFWLREPRQIQILTEQLAIFPYVSHTGPRTPREMFCSFVFTSPNFVLTTLQARELPIHAVTAGKRLTDVFITRPSRVRGSVFSHLRWDWSLGTVCPIEMCDRKEAGKSESHTVATVA